KADSNADNGVPLDEIREELLEQRQEILNLYEHDLREGQRASDEGSEDLVDRANSAYNREFMFSLSSTERDTLFKIEDALKKIDEGGYGSCSHCSAEIPLPRLKAVPWARYCIDCQELEEKGLLEES
ncbi:MAG: TraR/DksA family transcriptional regulator, partial [Thermoanaerobaculia bacterium]|nr:TraR/DksA family transcriptional regulator [Thermoanaerobaculia bacterium]